MLYTPLHPLPGPYVAIQNINDPAAGQKFQEMAAA